MSGWVVNVAMVMNRSFYRKNTKSEIKMNSTLLYFSKHTKTVHPFP